MILDALLLITFGLVLSLGAAALYFAAIGIWFLIRHGSISGRVRENPRPTFFWGSGL